MANSSFTKGSIETPVTPEHGGTGLSTLGTAGQTQVVNSGGTALEWGSSGHDGVDEHTASTNGYLTCGSSPSATTVFDTLGQGANDGAVKVTVDGTEHDNVVTDLRVYGAAGDRIDTAGTGTDFTNLSGSGQTFTTTSSQGTITGLTIYVKQTLGTGTATLQFYESDRSTPIGGSKDFAIAGQGDGTAFVVTLDEAIEVDPSTVYSFFITVTGTTTGRWRSYNTSVYSGGILYLGGTAQPTRDWDFILHGSEMVASSTSDIATALQIGLRARMSSNPTVAYDTDHYVITSGSGGTDSTVSVLSTPTSGTDLSGVGTAYFDGDAGTSTAGTGDNGKVALLDNDGLVPRALVEGSSEYAASAAAIFTGGEGPSAISVFNSLMAGANDGALKLTVDGTEHNVPVYLNISDETSADKISISGNLERRLETPHNGVAYGTGNTITIPAGMSTLNGFSVQSRSDSGGVKLFMFEIWDSPDRVTGTLIGSQGSISIGSYGGTGTFTLTTPIYVEEGDTYYCHIYPQSGGDMRLMYGSATYSGGQMYTGATPTLFSGGTYDFNIKVQGDGTSTFSTYDEVAVNVQRELRTATSGSEVIENNGVAFKITSGTTDGDSEISNPTTPTSGTDISGVGATPYLDLSNGSEHLSAGSANTVVKTNADGVIDGELVGSVIGDSTSPAGNTPHLALTDGLVTGWTNTNYTTILYTDANTTPTTIYGQTEADAHNSFCFPVKKGNYWRVTCNSSSGYRNLKFTPIGN